MAARHTALAYLGVRRQQLDLRVRGRAGDWELVSRQAARKQAGAPCTDVEAAAVSGRRRLGSAPARRGPRPSRSERSPGRSSQPRHPRGRPEVERGDRAAGPRPPLHVDPGLINQAASARGAPVAHLLRCHFDAVFATPLASRSRATRRSQAAGFGRLWGGRA